MPYTYATIDAGALERLEPSARVEALAGLGAEVSSRLAGASRQTAADVLSKCGGRQGRTAGKLGISPQRLSVLLGELRAERGQGDFRSVPGDGLSRIDWDGLEALAPKHRLVQLDESGRHLVAAARAERGWVVATEVARQIAEGPRRGARNRAAKALGLSPARLSQLLAGHEKRHRVQRLPEVFRLEVFPTSSRPVFGRLLADTRLYDRGLPPAAAAELEQAGVGNTAVVRAAIRPHDVDVYLPMGGYEGYDSADQMYAAYDRAFAAAGVTAEDRRRQPMYTTVIEARVMEPYPLFASPRHPEWASPDQDDYNFRKLYIGYDGTAGDALNRAAPILARTLERPVDEVYGLLYHVEISQDRRLRESISGDKGPDWRYPLEAPLDPIVFNDILRGLRHTYDFVWHQWHTNQNNPSRPAYQPTPPTQHLEWADLEGPGDRRP